jgi:hypothetical protein
MLNFIRKIIKFILRFFLKDFVPKYVSYPNNSKTLASIRMDCAGQIASDEIRRLLEGNEPCMISRFGLVELRVLLHYKYKVDTNNRDKVINWIIHNKKWWWYSGSVQALRNNAGFFPLTSSYINQFCELMINCMQNVDILGSWVPGENIFIDNLSHAKICDLTDLEPYYHQSPWSSALKGKRVLVIHPFADSICKQYSQNKDKLFRNPEILPDFNLITIKAVQSIAGNETPYKTWFDALDSMTEEIRKVDYDIAIIGCGAYGFPLASRVKDYGKKAVHLGGATQIMFGIKGKRWEMLPAISKYFNEYWIKPAEIETPPNAIKVENACYW